MPHRCCGTSIELAEHVGDHRAGCGRRRSATRTRASSGKHKTCRDLLQTTELELVDQLDLPLPDVRAVVKAVSIAVAMCCWCRKAKREPRYTARLPGGRAGESRPNSGVGGRVLWLTCRCRRQTC